MIARRLACFALFAVLATSQEQQPAPTPAPPQNELRQRAFAAENARRFGEAADAFLALSRGEPTRVEWIVAAGRCLGQASRFRDAVDLLDEAHKKLPGEPEVAAMLARTYLLQAERDRGVLNPQLLWASAVELAEGVLTQVPDHEDCRLVLAQARYLLGDWDEAVKQAEEAVRRHPQRPGTHVLLGRIASDQFRDLLRAYESKRDTLGDAERAELVGRIDQQRQAARKSYRRAAELDATRPFPHVALGQLAWLDKKPDDARAHFADALAIDPDVTLDHDALAQGLDWQARAAFYEAVRKRYAAGTGALPGKAARLWFYEGRARFDGAQLDAAKACFEQALAANPAFTNSHYYLFQCAWQRNDHDVAERHAAAYAEAGAAAFADTLRTLAGDRRAETAAVVKFLGDRAYQQKRIDASRDLNHVIACYLDSADAWNNHAFLCRETGKFEDALSSYQHALEKEPDSPQLLNDMGVILHYHLASDDNKQKAKALYQRALQLADKQLADAGVTGAERERATQARRDAQANLEALGK